ncbi:hypothetical protein DAEQUDRAFT_764688 [Daedalea quercina L-15889]|uniref:Transmembrane protein n=1 Tax=Daedalea quercina L-15889 TaxID=1314783 RepID=A0A165RB74_9APHY|nr:hypothetical protein DAEQUDRAFT_764688 [Daedalea quercina L-15889]
MAPTPSLFFTSEAFSPSAVSSAAAAAEDTAYMPSGTANYPLIGVGIAAWVIVCILVICIWLRRGKRSGAGSHWIDDEEKASKHERLLPAFWRKDHGIGGQHGLGFPIPGEKASTVDIEAHAAFPIAPKRARTTAPRLVHFSPRTPTILYAPPATPSYVLHGNVSAGGSCFWAPAWAVQAAEANAKAARSPSFSPTPTPTLSTPSLSPSVYSVDFPEVPAEIVARIRREPLPMFG